MTPALPHGVWLAYNDNVYKQYVQQQQNQQL